MTPDQLEPEQKEKAPRLIRNPASLAGAALATISLAYILFLFLITLLSPQGNPYLGVLTFLVFPAFLILGLLLIPVGMWHERNKRRRAAPTRIPHFPSIDLNIPAQRNTFAFFVVFLAFFITTGALGSYHGYQYTETVQFCGETCHTVMQPEYTAYLQSPHARVPCAECHVGRGASWYVRSKLSGSYQVYAALFHKYPQPIPTPVTSLRPAQATCEQCHWPRRFYGAQLKIFYHYAADEKNTSRQIRMLINTGGAEPNTGIPTGIHWHMNIANQITFIATDAKSQVIPWVQVRDMQGRVITYQSKGSTLTPQQIQQAPKHVMDCIDCHNRPSHIFPPPDESVDQSLLAGRIDTSLPFIKQQAVSALAKSYGTNAEAMRGIANGIQDFYETKYREVYSNRQAAIETAIAEVQHIYQSTIFPYMKVDWQTHPNNIGHFYSSGCFRCHDGEHVSNLGKVLSKDCNTCHTIFAQLESAVPLFQHEPATPFKHPIDIGDLTQVSCNDCHSGGVGP
jgi:nitrate/TMAO reductase-like tetraheme cytochrome c subunit